MATILIHVSEEFKKDLKVGAASCGKTMTDLIKLAVEEYLNEEKSKK